LVGFNDLQSLRPEIAAEAHGWDPKEVTVSSGKKKEWICPKGHIYEQNISDRTNKNQKCGCPYCANKRVLAGFNDLLTCYPDAASWAYGWDPSKVAPKSNKKLDWKCPEGHIFQQLVSRRTEGDGCPYCSKIGRGVLVGENDLKSQFTVIAAEADGWDPSTIRARSHQIKDWKCPLGHKYKAKVQSRTQLNSGCPVCTGRTVLEGFNDLKSCFPEIAAEAYRWDPTQYSKGNTEKFEWKCPEGHIYMSSINSRTNPGRMTGCPVCAKYGFNAEGEGWFYLMQRPGEQQIGITNKLSQRIKQHERNGWTLIDQAGPVDGRSVLRVETAFKRWLRAEIGIIEGTDENWATTAMEVRSLAELRARSGVETDLF
jgi:predicted GIY-YIG superfamily endonuclease